MTGILAAAAAGARPAGTVAIGASYSPSDTQLLIGASAGLKLKTSGALATLSTFLETDVDTWLTPAGSNNTLYEARMVTVSGTLSSGVADTWQSLASERAWAVSRASVGSKSFSGTLQIRRASDGTVLDSASVTMAAEVTSS